MPNGEGSHRGPGLGHRPAASAAADLLDGNAPARCDPGDDGWEGAPCGGACREGGGPFGLPEELRNEGPPAQHALIKRPALPPPAEGCEAEPAPRAAVQAASLKVRAPALGDSGGHERPVPALSQAPPLRKLLQDPIHGLPGARHVAE